MFYIHSLTSAIFATVMYAVYNSLEFFSLGIDDINFLPCAGHQLTDKTCTDKRQDDIPHLYTSIKSESNAFQNLSHRKTSITFKVSEIYEEFKFGSFILEYERNYWRFWYWFYQYDWWKSEIGPTNSNLNIYIIYIYIVAELRYITRTCQPLISLIGSNTVFDSKGHLGQTPPSWHITAAHPWPTYHGWKSN